VESGDYDGGGPRRAQALDISAVVEDAQDFHFSRRVVHCIEDIVVLVCCPANLARSPRFARPNGIAFWHDIKAVHDLVNSVCKIDGSQRIFKLNSDIAAGVRYVGLGLWRQLRCVFHVAIPSISSAWARWASIKLPATAESYPF